MEYSVIVPVHNSEKTIGKCINAILESQFNKPFELIVVDDASKDKTVNIAKDLSAKVITNSKCNGPSKARNIGARHAKGNTLIFIDSDILVFSDTLQKIDDFFSGKKEFIAISCNFYPKCDMTDSISRYKHLYMYYILLHSSDQAQMALTSTFAIKREIFERIGGFNENLLVNEDALLARELIGAGYRIALGKFIPIRHLHKYSLARFIKEEFRRSKTLTLMDLTKFKFKKIRADISTNHMANSILLLPFLIAGFFLRRVNPLFFIVPLAFFCLVNFNFLKLCKDVFGIKFMLKAIPLIILDCLICSIGIISAFLNFAKGKRI